MSSKKELSGTTPRATKSTLTMMVSEKQTPKSPHSILNKHHAKTWYLFMF